MLLSTSHDSVTSQKEAVKSIFSDNILRFIRDTNLTIDSLSPILRCADFHSRIRLSRFVN